MGIAGVAVLDLVQKVRSWIGRLSEAMSAAGGGAACCECLVGLGSPASRFRCWCCGRLFCKNCMRGDGKDEPKYCAVCFQAVAWPVSPEPVLEPGRLRFRNSRFAQLIDLQQQQQQQGFSPRSLYFSRSDEEDDDDENGKHFLSPMSDFSQDVSDLDSSSVSLGHENYSFKSVPSSPLDSPSRARDVVEYSPVKSGVSDHDALGSLRKPRVESEERCSYDGVLLYRSSESLKAQQPLDFENNGLIWYPPSPEEEYKDMENRYFEYDDEDDEVGESGGLFSPSNLDGDAFQLKERPNGANKEALKGAVRGHFRALVSQLLKAEGIHSGNDSAGVEWLEIVSSLAWQAAHFVKPDTSNGGSMDPGNYVKVKCMASGSPSDSALIKGVVCTKNVRHKRMISQHRNPRILILGGSLEYQKVPNKLASINAVLEEEIHHIKMAVSKIEAHRPNVLLVEKSVSPYAQEYLLTKEISLVLNVKKSLLERISRCTGAQIVPSIDHIASARLGQCETFRVARVSEDCIPGNHLNKKPSKTLMFFEGCPRRLGCTVLLKGACQDELKKLKHVVQYASFAAYHLSLETSFLADEGATLPQIQLKPTTGIEDQRMDMCIAVPSNSAYSGDQSVHQSLKEGTQGADSSEASSRNKRRLDVSCAKYTFSSDHQSSDDITVINSSQVNRDIIAKVSADMPICLRKSLNMRPIDTSDLLAGIREPEDDELQTPRSSSSTTHRNTDDKERARICDNNEVEKDLFSTSDSNQSILVSLSSSCILKGTICERSQLFRIKFYGNFDKPLGRYLRDDLFDQSSSCHACKEPVEAHVRCYTHQHGCLTINVKQLRSMKLPGECDGKIWMWHRCLKCKYKDGVPPAAPRVIMSDAAWGLSFGKFLELSFSNHTTANRIASCGHSLQRDCLRFYGFGSMVAFFRYSPVNILSVNLPPSLMDFTFDHQQEWVKREAAEISSKIESLHMEVLDAIYNIEQRITNFECQPFRRSIQNHISKLKDLLKTERNEYDVVLEATQIAEVASVKVAQDILQLNRLRRSLLIDSHMWDRCLYLLDTLSKTKGSTCNVDSQLTELSSHLRPRFYNTHQAVSKPLALEVTSGNSLLSKQHEEHNLQVLECKSNNLIETDLSIEILEGFLGPTVLSLASGQQSSSDEINASEDGSLSPGCNLSDKIDLAWTGSGPPILDPLADGSEADPVETLSLMDSPYYKKRMSPIRVHSFDSALRLRDKIHGGLTPASLHLFHAKSFDVSRDSSGLIKEPIHSQRSVQEIQRLNSLLGRTPAYISLMSLMTSDGARFMLPQNNNNDVVIAVYDNEPTSIIAYAIHSQEYADFVTRKADPYDGSIVNEKFSMARTVEQSVKQWLLDDIHYQGHGSDEPQTLHAEAVLDPKETHFKISFDDSSFHADKAKFSVTCYFAKQFDALRKKYCPSELDFVRSLSRCKRWKAQGGKSNVYFAKTLDERFIIKQVTKTELESFVQFAPQYFKYLLDAISSGSPTCLAKVLGVYQVTVKHLKGGREVKMDLMVMENLFFKRNISRVYDLKGSSRARYNPDTTGRNKVLLDLNLLETLRTKPIFLGGRAKRSLERAVWNDTNFLASIGVMDYSLLVGIDEEKKELVIGIIDFMRQYTWDKHLETWVKTSGLLGGSRNASPTVISPVQYKKRFRKAMSNYFLTVPDQWSC